MASNQVNKYLYMDSALPFNSTWNVSSHRILRGLTIQNEVIGIDFVEYTPLLDDRHYNTGLLVNRLMRVTLAGMAACKVGITDPDYIAPEGLGRE